MLIKDSFPFTHLFLCYQTMENTENYLYTRFSIETNEVFMSHYLLKSFIYAMLNSFNIFELILSPPRSLCDFEIAQILLHRTRSILFCGNNINNA